MKEFVILIIICMTLIWVINLIIFIIQEFCNITLRYERFHDIPVEVCKKEYRKPYNEFLQRQKGKNSFIEIVHHEEEFIVYVMFEGREYCFINERLYKEVCINEIIFVCVHKGYNRKGKLKNICLTLE